MRWVYQRQDLGEPRFPDGTVVRRPVVTVRASTTGPDYPGVVDSGSPITVASEDLMAEAGIDLGRADPIMEVPFGFGRGARPVAVFTVQLELVPPDDDGTSFIWTLPVGLITGWRLAFPILFGQLGWFDTFPTTIDRTTTVVEVPDPA